MLLAITMVMSFVHCDRKIAGGAVDGAAIFQTYCARCHGPKGIPSAAMVARVGVKPLNSQRVATELSDEDIRKQVLKGSVNKQMPSFVSVLTDPQIQAVIDHVRSLKKAAPQAPVPPQ